MIKGKYERKEAQSRLQFDNALRTFQKIGEIKEPIAKVLRGQYKSDLTIVSLREENKKLKEKKSPLDFGKEVLMTVIGVIIGLSITSFIPNAPITLLLVILVILFAFRGIILKKYGR
jgi:F0F1-type ATP synthase assembly protein I